MCCGCKLKTLTSLIWYIAILSLLPYFYLVLYFPAYTTCWNANPELQGFYALNFTLHLFVLVILCTETPRTLTKRWLSILVLFFVFVACITELVLLIIWEFVMTTAPDYACLFHPALIVEIILVTVILFYYMGVHPTWIRTRYQRKTSALYLHIEERTRDIQSTRGLTQEDEKPDGRKFGVISQSEEEKSDEDTNHATDMPVELEMSTRSIQDRGDSHT